jgi:hypothetical protein
MRAIFAIVTICFFGLAAGQASATCIGSDAFSTCTDSYGNSYNVQRFGNQTFMNGYNAQTGNSWSQNSTTLGNTTFHNGTAGNGNSWNMTDQRMGNMRFLNGNDSQGNSFSHTCGPWGCD